MIVIYPTQHDYIQAEFLEDAEIVAYFSDNYIKVVTNSVNGQVGEMTLSGFQDNILADYK